MPNVVRIGDSTSHGGKVIESGAPHFIVGGKAIALVGDKCICPIKRHQNCSIAIGNQRQLISGKAVAYEGDITTCGAILISTVGNFSLC